MLLLSCLLSSVNMARMLQILNRMVAEKFRASGGGDQRPPHIIHINFRSEMEQFGEGDVTYAMHAINCEEHISCRIGGWEKKLFATDATY